MESVLEMLQTFAAELKAESLEQRLVRIERAERQMAEVAVSRESDIGIFEALNAVSDGPIFEVTLKESPRPESLLYTTVVGSPPLFKHKMRIFEDATKPVASSVLEFA
jgi:hypothetical protein